MKSWQKVAGWVILCFFTLHLIRDLSQDFGLNVFWATVLTKTPRTPYYPLIWQVFNTYLFDLSGIILPVLFLKRNRFGRLGQISVILSLIFIGLWSVSWLWL